MEQQAIHNYLCDFFESVECSIEEKTKDYLTVQLTVEMDKALMNRPFYWHYIEKTGGVPNPQKLTFITNFSSDQKGEHIHFGSPRLHQIFHLTKEEGSFIRLFENRNGEPTKQIPLIPWLCLNVAVSYQCDLKKDRFRSIGLNLLNGQMIDNFHFSLLEKSLNLVPKIPDFAFTYSPLIMPKSGIGRIRQFLENEIKQEDLSWANAALERLEEDLQLLNQFYEEIEEKPESYEIEKAAIEQLYEPKIIISIINGGLFYLTKEAFQ
ncbi:YqhG family protein [Bacillus kwashiorkori]|uniref:YqhG family protein n=1 Tax=Bacillus kwashiorkori TaxID=1522318 RepID=UPI0007856740|nr:YqhG family protein [Bacillus kwashiorkori]